MNLSEYQQLAIQSDRTGDDKVKSLMITLLGLAGEAGSLLTEYKKWLRDGDAYRPFSDQVSEEIGDILWYLANLASKLKLDLGEIASENVAKIEERWPKQRPASSELFANIPHRYDRAFPLTEQLPLELKIDFIEQLSPAANRLLLRRNGVHIGDPLTDNSHINDGYRYHDVFHIGCATMLGWSPVMRRILKCKRKSVPAVDVNEDGARAMVTEEGVSVVVFNYARDHSMLENARSVYDLLPVIRGMTRPFEVRTRSLADWEQTILASYQVWRELMKHRGGTVIGDATSQQLRFESPTW
ncbi:MAG: nucleoside triphosphate pyrophosphohydrolase family protein [Phycisphaerales bacterium]|nr:nucleoside triphosphate pyrophosphohydrolase family protein [Phycisphaerales bacterium]